MIAGTLEIQLLANMARLQADMDAAKRSVGGAMADIEKAVGLAKTALGAFAGVASVAAFAGMIRGSIDAAESLKDLAAQTGSTVEVLSAMSAIGKTSDTSIETISSAMNKLSKNMAVANEESKGASSAVQALGLDLEQFKKLSPEEQMSAVAKAMDKFADGGGKSAAAMAMYGKEGAKLIPFLKDIAVAGDLNAKVTAAQAEMADNFNDNLTKITISSDAWKRSLSMGLLPVLSDMSDAWLEMINGSGGFRDEIKKLSDDGTLEGWARDTVTALSYVLDAANGVTVVFAQFGSSLAVIAKDIITANDLMKIGITGLFTQSGQEQARAILAERAGFVEAANADMEARLSKTLLGQKLRDAMAAAKFNRESAAPAGAKDTLIFDDTKDAKTKKSPLDTAFDTFSAEAAKREAILTAEAGGVAKLTDAEKWALEVMVKVRDGKLGQSDAERRLIGERVEAVSVLEKLNAQEKLNEAAIGRHVDAIAADQTRAQSIIDANTALRQQSAELGLSSDALVALKQSRIDEQIALENWRLGLIGGTEAEGSQATAIRETIAALQDSKAALAENAAAQKAADAIKAQGDLWKSVESTAQQTFSGIFESGASSFERLRTALKNGLYDLLYQMTMKKWIIQIAAGVSGTAAAESAFGKASSLGFDSLIGTAATTGYEATSDTFFSSAGSGLLGMLPSFAVGTDYVPEDMVAQIHKGEKIVPAAYNKDGGDSSDSAVAISMPVTIDARGADSGVEQRLAGAVTQLQSWVVKSVPGIVRSAQLRNRQSPTV